MFVPYLILPLSVCITLGRPTPRQVFIYSRTQKFLDFRARSLLTLFTKHAFRPILS